MSIQHATNELPYKTGLFSRHFALSQLVPTPYTFSQMVGTQSSTLAVSRCDFVRHPERILHLLQQLHLLNRRYNLHLSRTRAPSRFRPLVV